ncbi:hypothetical protein [Pseudotenacibaculum haliotis]|uniref:Uncharacterized protein n=1 Tax=Pseudotenacibaculum haliotis TaxID=1862138 RepID=A0ABW5LQ94_9FLAO
MELTEKEIEELYKFTRKHYVIHYDLQTELVDHLANDIETIWLEKPNLSFREARDISFKKFGVFGFSDVVSQKEKQMTKKYWRILWRFVKEWFDIPKIIGTAAIFSLFFFLLQIRVGPIILVTAFIIFCLSSIVFEIIIKYKVRSRKKKEQKIFLLEEMIHQTKGGLIFVYLINIWNALNFLDIDFFSLSVYWIGLVSFLLTLLLISFYVTHFTIPNKAEELLEEVYPEYKLQKNL